MASKGKRIISILIATILLACAVPTVSMLATDITEGTESKEQNPDAAASDNTPTGTVDPTEWVTRDDYEKVAESDTYNMYLYAPRLSIVLENKKTGEILESTLSDEKDDGQSNEIWRGFMKSGVVLSAIIGTNNTYQVDLLNDVNSIDVTKLDNGFSAKVFFKKYQFGFTVNVSLEKDQLLVEVPEESILEQKDGTYIGTISLFPMMGYSYLGEKEGYMLIPDGNGALVYLNDKEGRFQTGFSQMIYGEDAGFASQKVETYLWKKYDTVIDPNPVIAPVYGMIHTDDRLGYLAVVEEGDKRASIEVQPNGVMTSYNRCYAKFLLRDVYVQPLNQSNSGTVQKAEENRTKMDLKVRFILLSGEDADYSGMANAYRDYLLQNALVVPTDISYQSRVDFLGSEREKFLLGTTAVPMTTVEQMEEIFGELREEGVSSLLSVYKGWQSGGLYNLPITKYKADASIGGTGKLTSLIKEAAEENYNIFLYNDTLQMNGSTNSTTFNAVKMVNKRTLKEESYKQVYRLFYYVLPAKAETTLEKFLKSYTAKGVSNLAVAGSSDHLFSYSSKGSYYTRLDTADVYEEMLSYASDNANLILEQPSAYLWKYTKAFLDMPLTSSQYMYVDEEIPFLTMVLKGIMPVYSEYVNFEANKTEYFLKMVESGAYPSFYITYENSSDLIYTNSSDLYSTQYSTYKDSIVEYDTKLRELASKTGDSNIIKHEKLDSGVTKVTYSNDVVVYVNYSKTAKTVDGISIDAMSYEVGEANE